MNATKRNWWTFVIVVFLVCPIEVWKKTKMLTPVSDVRPVCLIISWYCDEKQDWISVICGEVDWICHYIGGKPVVYNFLSVAQEFNHSQNRFHKKNVQEIKIKVKKTPLFFFFFFSGEFNVSRFCNTEEIRTCILPSTGKGIFLNSVEGVVFRLNLSG